MKKLLKINFVVLFVFVFALSAFAQSNGQIEKELTAAVKDVQKYGTYGGGYDEDKLSKVQDAFAEKLLKYTKTASTLQFKFSVLAQYMDIATSDDGKFRIYSWDLEDGGTMHDFASVYQYQATDGKVYSKTDEISTQDEDSGGGGFVTDIYTLDTKAGAVYIVCSTFIGSTKDNFQSANLYKIEGDKLDDKVKLIKTKSGLTNTLGFGYDFFSVVDRKERPIRLISFDKKTKTLKIPVVIEDTKFSSGRVTNKSISYRFDGQYFVKVG
ncbi:MAG TPA: hypothetical protein VGC76_10300 [Pyrinomonadaceae bacterium]|jgi:hypothetical protein